MVSGLASDTLTEWVSTHTLLKLPWINIGYTSLSNLNGDQKYILVYISLEVHINISMYSHGWRYIGFLT